MYHILLMMHSWLRWGVVIALLCVLVKFTTALVQNRPYTRTDRILSSVLLMVTHLQFILGVLLYFVWSPFIHIGKVDLSVIMKQPVLRYWNLEHVVSMFLFVVLVQAGFSISKRQQHSEERHKKMLLYTVLAFVFLIAVMPWPFREHYGRVLFRL